MSLPASDKALFTAINDSEFNGLLAEAFLCGLYTSLFAYTLCTLLRKENKKAYTTVLTLLWVLVMVTFGFDWRYNRTAFVVDNDSPLEIAKAVEGVLSTEAFVTLNDIFSFSSFWLADALLIWRCYILWDGRRWVLFPLPILLISAIVLSSLSMAPQFLKPGEKTGFIFFISFFAVSIAITFTGTFMIVLRILLVTRRSPLTSHTSTYFKIRRILVESGIVYTIAMFIVGVSLAIELICDKPDSILLNELIGYMEAILTPLSGIGPTLIAVRVGHEAPLQTDSSTSRSGSHSRALSHPTFKRSIQRNDTLDIEAGTSGCSDSPTDSSIGQEDHTGHIEKIPDHGSDTTL